MSSRTAARLAWSSGVVSLALALTSISIASVPSDLTTGEVAAYTFVYGGILLASATVGALIASRHPRNPIGWILCGMALLIGLTSLTDGYADRFTSSGAGSQRLAETAAWWGNWTWVPLVLVPPTFVLLLFPDGRLPSPRWRPLPWCAALAITALSATIALEPGPLDEHPSVANPYAVGKSASEFIGLVGVPLLLASLVAAVAALIIRFRRADPAGRQQIKWLVYAGCVAIVTLVVGVLVGSFSSDDVGNAIVLSGVLGVPLAIGIAILRYRLYDIDVVINRTLVYGSVTALLAGAYLGLVLLFQLAFSPLTEENSLAVALSTLAVAALFRPARNRVQALVDRRFYRRKYDTAQTLTSFAARLREEVDLDALRAELTAVVAETMQPAHVSLWLRAGALSVTPSVTIPRRSSSTKEMR
jgi:hypothetical protein